MCFFIILILHYSGGLKNWNEILYICENFFASLAQLVEQLIRNEQVVGSSPIGGSISWQNRLNNKFADKNLFIIFVGHIKLRE